MDTLAGTVSTVRPVVIEMKMCATNQLDSQGAKQTSGTSRFRSFAEFGMGTFTMINFRSSLNRQTFWARPARLIHWSFAVACSLFAGGTYLASAGTIGPVSLTNSAVITIPDTGAATPDYPSKINVSGMQGTVTKVKVTLTGINHQWSRDPGALLVGPGGQMAVLFTGMGGGGAVSFLDLTFSDSAANYIPHDGSLTSGEWKPADWEFNDHDGYFDPNVAPFFPPPAPDRPPLNPLDPDGPRTFYPEQLSAFNGLSPNGDWSLYVADGSIAALSHGAIDGGWSLEITTFNNAPTVSAIDDQTTDEDVTLAPVSFTVADVETPAGSLTVTGTSSDQDLVPDGNIIISGSGANRTVSVIPAPDQSGSVIITVQADDGNDVGTTSFLLTISPVNDAPSITSVADQTIPEDGATAALSFTIGDIDNVIGDLSVTGSSSDTVLVPNANVVIGGSGANRTVTVTPVPNGNGATTITLSVTDGSATTTTQFLVTVTPVNDAPSITPIDGIVTSEDVPTGPIGFIVGDIETPATSLTVTAASSNPDLVPVVNIVLSGSGAVRTATITPAPNQFGMSTITLTVSDGSASADSEFDIFVNSVNDAPTLDPIGDLFVAENSGIQNVSLTGIGSGAPNEVQVLSITAASSNPGLIPDPVITYTSADATGTLSFTPAASATGTATITVTLKDDGGTLFGGQDTTTRTFNVTVYPRPVIHISMVGGIPQISFSTISGLNYTLEYKDSFSDAAWTPVDSQPGTGAVVTIPDPAPGSPTRFYQVRVH